MTVKELVLDSLENFESFYIDHISHTKQLTQETYEKIAGFETKSFYLDIKNNKPCIILVLDKDDMENL